MFFISFSYSILLQMSVLFKSLLLLWFVVEGATQHKKMPSYSAEQTLDQVDGQLNLIIHCSYNQVEVCDYD